MGNIGEAINAAVFSMVILACLFGAAVTLFFIYAVPWIWSWVKPWLHMVTA